MPAGIAVQSSGKIYVSDSAAQRIRVIFPNGTIKTVAGGGRPVDAGLWVPGDYRDGAGLQARFNRPTGIALGSHGELYIADTYNHCIRLLQPNGSVTTFAGDPRHAGDANGPRRQARFTRPLGIALDAEGNLYVADAHLRKITTDGIVSSVAVGSTPLGVAVSRHALFVSDLTGIVAVTPDGKVKRFPGTFLKDQCILGNASFAQLCDGAQELNGDASLGFPWAIAALDDHRVIFTDLRSNTIRTLDIATNTLELVGGELNEDTSADGGGFRDGPLAVSRYNAPYGLALDPRGRVIIADAGNKRIRALRLDDGAGSPAKARVAVFGGMSVYYGTPRETSIEALLERDLNQTGHRVAVVALFDTDPGGDLMQRYRRHPDASNVNAVVLDLHPQFVAALLGVAASDLKHSQSWQGPLREQLVAFETYLKTRNIGLVCLTYPMPQDFAPLEAPWRGILADSDGSSEVATAVASVARESGLAVVDMTSAFLAEVVSPRRRPLFAVDNDYLAVRGRELVASALSQQLQSASGSFTR